MTENIEQGLIRLIATDRIDIPISSMSGKLKRRKSKLAETTGIEKNSYLGERTYARIVTEDTMKARGMKEGIEQFAQKYPRYGDILNGMIEEQRADREVTLYFGMNEGCKITADDYLGVMTELGFTEATARGLYPELMDISRNLSKKRDEKRSILIG